MPNPTIDPNSNTSPGQRTAVSITPEIRRLPAAGVAEGTGNQPSPASTAAPTSDSGEGAGIDRAAGLLVLSMSLARMPVQLSVAVPVRDFRVKQLLTLSNNDVLKTTWGHGEDLPLLSGDVQLAWTEFEVIDSRLGVRVTRLG